MTIQKIKHNVTIMHYGKIAVGTFLMAIAVGSIYDIMQLVTGGATGISIIVKNVMAIPLWLTNMVLNIPLFILAGKKIGARFVLRTLIATTMLTVFLAIVPPFYFLPNDIFLNAILGGGIMGIGLGIILSQNATSGGTELLATMLQGKWKRFSVANIIVWIDGVIILLGALMFGMEKATYALVAVFVSSRVADSFLDGLKNSRMAYIISDSPDEIAKGVMEDMERGITEIEIKGMYSGNNRNMLMCVVSKKEIIELRELVYKYDEKAFVIVSDVKEALGEGFTSLST